MAAAKKEVYQPRGADVSRIRFTLQSTEVAKLETMCTRLKEQCKKLGLKATGPVRLPTKQLRVTTRKSPGGNGTASWDCFTMRIHKRIVDTAAPKDLVQKLTNIKLEPGVDIQPRNITE